MHCPNCGNQSELDQKFCRKCGFNLEPVSKLIVNSPDADQLKLQKAEETIRTLQGKDADHIATLPEFLSESQYI